MAHGALVKDGSRQRGVGTNKHSVWPYFLIRTLLTASATSNATSGSVHLHAFLLLLLLTWLQDIKLILPDNAANANIPKEFTINMTNRKVTNTYVFSEREIHFKKEPSISQSAVQNGTARYSPYPKLPPSKSKSFGFLYGSEPFFFRSDIYRWNSGS